MAQCNENIFIFLTMILYCNTPNSIILLVCRLSFISAYFYNQLNRNDESNKNMPKCKNNKHRFSSLVHSHKIIFHDNKYHFRPF